MGFIEHLWYNDTAVCTFFEMEMNNYLFFKYMRQRKFIAFVKKNESLKRKIGTLWECNISIVVVFF